MYTREITMLSVIILLGLISCFVGKKSRRFARRMMLNLAAFIAISGGIVGMYIEMHKTDKMDWWLVVMVWAAGECLIGMWENYFNYTLERTAEYKLEALRELQLVSIDKFKEESKDE